MRWLKTPSLILTTMKTPRSPRLPSTATWVALSHDSAQSSIFQGSVLRRLQARMQPLQCLRHLQRETGTAWKRMLTISMIPHTCSLAQARTSTVPAVLVHNLWKSGPSTPPTDMLSLGTSTKVCIWNPRRVLTCLVYMCMGHGHACMDIWIYACIPYAYFSVYREISLLDLHHSRTH